MHQAPVSVVIICYNAAATIQKAIASALQLTDDVIIADSGSTDGSKDVVLSTKARLVCTAWNGFGATKNRGNKEAKYDWILSMDADEELSSELIDEIKKIDFANKRIIYYFKRINYLGGKAIQFGDWQNDWVKRIFHRDQAEWDTSPVHEKLIHLPTIKLQKLNGLMHHYTANNIEAYNKKLERYSLLMAEKYYVKGKKAHWYNIYLSPVFNFTKCYLLLFGWLDKKAGWQIARAQAGYTFKKYKQLRLLRSKQNRR